MHDLPRGPALLQLAREVLLQELLPLLPEERRLDARLVANAMAIAQRDNQASAAAIVPELARLYGASESSGDGPDLLRRFAHELRAGAFEKDRAARRVLWQLTIARLRESNPRFLAANGIAQ